jgi:hypothetical protein
MVLNLLRVLANAAFVWFLIGLSFGRVNASPHLSPYTVMLGEVGVRSERSTLLLAQLQKHLPNAPIVLVIPEHAPLDTELLRTIKKAGYDVFLSVYQNGDFKRLQEVFNEHPFDGLLIDPTRMSTLVIASLQRFSSERRIPCMLQSLPNAQNDSDPLLLDYRVDSSDPDTVTRIVEQLSLQVLSQHAFVLFADIHLFSNEAMIRWIQMLQTSHRPTRLDEPLTQKRSIA